MTEIEIDINKSENKSMVFENRLLKLKILPCYENSVSSFE